MAAAVDRMFHFETPDFAFRKKPVILCVTGNIMPDQTQTQTDAEKHVLLALREARNICLGLAPKGHGYEITLSGKGSGPLTVSYKVHMGPIM